MTYRFIHDEFNMYTNFLPECGLGVYSENKFFYNYYLDGVERKYTDLRISSILYRTVCINLSDGTGNYMANNVKCYDYQRMGKALMPNYKDVRYYGYTMSEDGSGKWFADTSAKLNLDTLSTKAFKSLDAVQAEDVTLYFAEYYCENN